MVLALTPTPDLVVVDSGSENGAELARYKISQHATYAYPVIIGNQIFIKDQNAVSRYVID